MRVSHGCVRLYPENIELLYEVVEIGERVQIINEPYLLGRRDGELYFESHQPLEDDSISPEDRLSILFEASLAGDLGEREKDHVRSLASIASGLPSRVAAFDSAEILARARPVHNIVEQDPEAPTLSEVREMIDEAVRGAESEGEGETL